MRGNHKATKQNILRRDVVKSIIMSNLYAHAKGEEGVSQTEYVGVVWLHPPPSAACLRRLATQREESLRDRWDDGHCGCDSLGDWSEQRRQQKMVSSSNECDRFSQRHAV